MPGIFGVIDRTRRTAAAPLLARIAAALAHRPWYDHDTWTADTGAVGLGRSAIGILNREPQPVTSADGRLTLVMSGEFYRTEALRDRLEAARVSVAKDATDADLALLAVAALGPSAARLMDGAFVLAVFDGAGHNVTIINDRFGQYPTYYSVGSETLVFAPEVAAVLCAPFVPRTLDLTAVAECLRFQHLLDTRTYHAAIQQFPHGSIGRFDLDTGRWSIERYWDWDDIPPLEMSFEEAVREASVRLRDAVRVRSTGALRPAAFLSGGLDSRTLAGLLVETHPAPVTATFGIRGCRDVYYAERIARAIGSRHRWFDLPDGRWVLEQLPLHFALTEGFHSWVHMHGMTMLPELRESVDYYLTGWDGGTMMGHPDCVAPHLNHPPDHAALIPPTFDGLTRTWTWPGLSEAEERQLYTPAYSKELVGRAFDSMAAVFAPYQRYRVDNRAEYFYVRNHCFRLTQNMVTFARSHIEVRSPFWDSRLIDLAYGVRPEVRGHRTMYRELITRELPRLARIPWDKRETLPTTHRVRHDLQAAVVKVQNKLGLRPARATLYADYETYLRTDLRAWGEGLLLNPRARYREIVDPEYVRSLVARHMSGSEIWTIGKIASLITLEMVLSKYFD